MDGKATQLQQMVTQLRTRLLVMCAAVGISLDEACEAFHSGDTSRAVAVIDGDGAINGLEMEIDEQALTLLARNQPVAHDLERIGDEAVSIAERAVLLQGPPPVPVARAVATLISSARRLFTESAEIFRTEDWRAALRLCSGQDEIMQMEVIALHRFVDSIAAPAFGDTRGMQRYQVGMQGILICRALNRICGRSINIAEHTYFIANGVNIKHRREIPADDAGADARAASAEKRWGA